jgi:ubiquinone/menaquinone biosynthesis C-methylase UbiE
MHELYGTNLAKVYDEIYQGFIDYPQEYKFYKNICQKYGASNILEIACGTGNLTPFFIKDFKNYIGLDFSKAMLAIARKKNPSANFIQGDMRQFSTKEQLDAILITGRSTSYLTSDSDLEATFSSVRENLKTTGVFIFDCIDSERFMRYILENKHVRHESNANEKEFYRDSEWNKIESESYHLIEWKAEYFKIENNDKIFLGQDQTIFRAFSPSEIKQKLKSSGFKLLELFDRPTYAFDTYMFVAEKLKN